MKIFFSPRCLDYEIPGHPESPLRIRLVADYLVEKGRCFEEPSHCTESDILRVHSQSHLARVRHENFLDADTPPFPGILSFATLAAGAAIDSARCALNGEDAFSLMRPPGHHATRDRVMGFCYLNNIAIAAAAMQEENPGLKVAILDIDCHHGNGSEAIFHNREHVLFVSLHQSPLYPGSGLTTDGNTVNFPLMPGTDGTAYKEALQDACRVIDDFSPGLLGVSAGFDTFQGDPLTAMMLTIDDYYAVGRLIRTINAPLFVIMEGGYHAKLAESVLSLILGLEG